LWFCINSYCKKGGTVKVSRRYQEKDVWKQRFVGYSCTHGLKLEFNLDMRKLGATLGAIAGCDADTEFNVRFSNKDPNAVSEQLLENAVENAK